LPGGSDTLQDTGKGVATDLGPKEPFKIGLQNDLFAQQDKLLKKAIELGEGQRAGLQPGGGNNIGHSIDPESDKARLQLGHDKDTRPFPELRQTKLPAQVEKLFATAYDNQVSVEIHVVEGDDPDPDDCIEIVVELLLVEMGVGVNEGHDGSGTGGWRKVRPALCPDVPTRGSRRPVDSLGLLP
jgi:hypothetical protein